MNFTPEQIVLAGLSMTGSNKPSEMECVKKSDDSYVVTYNPPDSQELTFDCMIKGNQVRWFGKSIGGWNENNRVYFSVLGDELRMEYYNWGQSVNVKYFRSSDF